MTVPSRWDDTDANLHKRAPVRIGAGRADQRSVKSLRRYKRFAFDLKGAGAVKSPSRSHGASSYRRMTPIWQTANGIRGSGCPPKAISSFCAGYRGLSAVRRGYSANPNPRLVAGNPLAGSASGGFFRCVQPFHWPSSDFQ